MPIYCINLKHRQDRKKQSIEEFEKIGIPPQQVIFPPFTKDVRGGVYGCFDSHVKIWHDFYLHCPNDSYALIFEDDFLAPPNGEQLIKQAKRFLYENEGQVDILHLHDLGASVEHPCNNGLFMNGYGLGCHAYFVTRSYIDSIMAKHRTFPVANGRHIDYELTMNVKNRDNRIYTDKNFYSRQEGFMQRPSLSDNLMNTLDPVGVVKMRSKGIRKIIMMLMFCKTCLLLDDESVKKICCFFYPIVTLI